MMTCLTAISPDIDQEDAEIVSPSHLHKPQIPHPTVAQQKAGHFTSLLLKYEQINPPFVGGKNGITDWLQFRFP